MKLEGIEGAGNRRRLGLGIASATVGQLRLAWRGPVEPDATVQQLLQADGYVFAASATRDSWSVWAFPASCGTGGTTCDPLWHTAPVGVHLGASGTNLAFADGMLFVGGEDVSAFRPTCRTDGGVCSPAWTGRGAGGFGSLVAG